MYEDITKSGDYKVEEKECGITVSKHAKEFLQAAAKEEGLSLEKYIDKWVNEKEKEKRTETLGKIKTIWDQVLHSLPVDMGFALGNVKIAIGEEGQMIMKFEKPFQTSYFGQAEHKRILQETISAKMGTDVEIICVPCDIDFVAMGGNHPVLLNCEADYE